MPIQIVPIESCPGQKHFMSKAKQSGYIEGGVTFVTDQGKFLFIPISMVNEAIHDPEILLKLLHTASKALSHELSRLS